MNNYSNSYVAFIDVLGYKNYLTNDRRNGTDIFKTKLTNALNTLSNHNSERIRCTVISDSIIISGNFDSIKFSEFISVARSLFIAFLEQRIFIRGGITLDRHFTNSTLTYSHAISRAYELESRVATYPRIIIDSNTIGVCRENGQITHALAETLICKQGNTYFINTAGKDNIDHVYQAARQLYLESERFLLDNDREMQKHIWFQDYILSHEAKTSAMQRYIPGISVLSS